MKEQTKQSCKTSVSGSRFVPMLFSTPMVQATLNKTKTETRRIIKHKTEIEEIKPVTRCLENQDDWNKFILTDINGEDFLIEPKVNVNNIIWVRETFQITDFLHPSDENYGYIYKASENGKNWENSDENWKWKPSLFMPKDACRIFLKCVSVHAERLQDIDEQSAINEGIERIKEDGMLSFRSYAVKYDACCFPIVSYQTLWQKINGRDSWNKNPFVWVYKFERIEKPQNFI